MEKESSYAVETEYSFAFFAFHASPSSKEVKEIFFFVCAWNALLFVEEEKVQHFVHEKEDSTSLLERVGGDLWLRER